MRGIWKTVPLILGLSAACVGPGTYSSIAVEEGANLHVMVTPMPTAEQLAMVAVLAEQVVEAEQLSYDLQESSKFVERIRYQVHLENLIGELEQRGRLLEESGALRSEISRISLRAGVAVPLEELRLTLAGTRGQGPGLPVPY